MARNNPKPSGKINWQAIGEIIVPSPARKLAGWLFNIKPPAQSFNWFWNLTGLQQFYSNAQVQDWIVIDSDADEGDYATLVAYIADAPAAGDRILVKEDQTITAQFVLPDNVTLKFLDGSRLLCATDIATSVLKLGSNPIIEGVLNIVLSHTGTTAKAVEYDGDNAVGKINIENSSTGTLTTGHHINANKTGNRVEGFIDNTGGGTLTNEHIDNSTEDSNILEIRSGISNQITRNQGAKSFRDGFEFDLGSDADGDIYYRDGGILKRLPKGTNEDFLSLKAGIPSWQIFPSFSVHRDSVSQSIPDSANTKIEWTTKEFDTNSDFDITTNYRFTPTIAGKYLLSARVSMIGLDEGDEFRVQIFKNGTLYKLDRMKVATSSWTGGLNLSIIADANGSTDYFEVFVYHTFGITTPAEGSSFDTWFNGSRIA